MLNDNLMTRTVRSVKERGLTERELIFGGRVTDIIAELGATNKTDVSVDFLRLCSNVYISAKQKKIKDNTIAVG